MANQETCFLILILPNRVLSSVKIVKGERNVGDPMFFTLTLLRQIYSIRNPAVTAVRRIEKK